MLHLKFNYCYFLIKHKFIHLTETHFKHPFLKIIIAIFPLNIILNLSTTLWQINIEGVRKKGGKGFQQWPLANRQ